MIAHASPEQSTTCDQSTRRAGAKASNMLVVVGMVLVLGAALWAWLSTGVLADEPFHAESAPTAVIGIVQLLADHEHSEVADFEGESIAAIAARAKAAFGDEAPPQLDQLLSKPGGSGFPQFLSSYLVAFTFTASIALGCLFFVLIQHLTRAGWSVVIRRVAEIGAATLAPLGVLGLLIVIPLLFGDHSLYEWNDASHVAKDELLQHKRPYLNPGFFAARYVFYFAVWGVLGWFFLSRSRLQDQTGDPQLTTKMESAAPVGMLLFAITTNFFAFDLLMSLAPHWFSAVYGVYYFAGSVVAALSAMIIAIVLLQRVGAATQVTTEHFHDLGKLLFGFVFFWGYIAFSQYMLIWYANIPEETTWYLRRQENGWQYLALAILFGHLLIPFLGMMSRRVRRNPKALFAWAVWLLVMHWLDLYWNVAPQFSATLTFTFVDVLTSAGMCLVLAALVLRIATNQSWSPQRDPRLDESLAFHNV